MNSTEEIKYFSAVTYDNNTYNFAVTPEGEISCIEFGISTPTSKIEIKPNFVLRDQTGRTVYSLDDHFRNRNQKKSNESLISQWNIPDDVFQYLIEERKIMYSTQFGLLYGFDPKHAYDSYSQARLIRMSKEKPEKLARILAPLKAGKFH